MAMTIAVPREIRAGERRVAATPETVGQLLKLGFAVNVEAEAGLRASFDDDAYRAAGAQVISDTRALWADADIVVKVRAPEFHSALGADETTLLKKGATLISFIWPAQNAALLDLLAAGGTNVMAMDCVPRISRAQKLDALSSMANMAGYRADHRRRQDAAREGDGDRRGRGGPRGYRRGAWFGRDRARLRYPSRGRAAGRKHGRGVPQTGH
jgi:NAD(P) transhydrogenase subunit alpha